MRLRVVLSAAAIGCGGPGAAGGESSDTTGGASSSADPSSSSTGSSGNDRYYVQGLSAGASNCNGIGLFVDNAGDEAYTGVSDLSSGVGNVSTECTSRATAVSIGVMLDADGVDAYDYAASTHPSFVAPTDGGTWGYARASLPSEHGGGRDGNGDTGVRSGH